MLATSARTVPCIALACGLAALNVSVSPFFSMAMLSLNRCDSEPSGPLTEISPAVSVTSTLGGNLIGLFPMRDMASSSSGDDADHFAADAAGARLAVGHEAARGRDDGDAQPVHHARNLAAHRDVTQLVAPEPELAVHAAWPPGELAPVAQPRRARVARQLLQLAPRRQPLFVGKLDVANKRQQLGAPLGVLLHRQPPPLVAIDDSRLRHGFLSS